MRRDGRTNMVIEVSFCKLIGKEKLLKKVLLNNNIPYLVYLNNITFTYM